MLPLSESRNAERTKLLTADAVYLDSTRSMLLHAPGICSTVPPRLRGFVNGENSTLQQTLMIGSGLSRYGRRGSLNAEAPSRSCRSNFDFGRLCHTHHQLNQRRQYIKSNKAFAVTPRATCGEAGIIFQLPYKGLAPRPSLHLGKFYSVLAVSLPGFFCNAQDFQVSLIS